MRQKCSIEEEIQQIITAICLSTVVDAMRSCSLGFTEFQGIGENNSISSVQSLSHVRLFVTPWTAARQASLSIINS